MISFLFLFSISQQLDLLDCKIKRNQQNMIKSLDIEPLPIAKGKPYRYVFEAKSNSTSTKYFFEMQLCHDNTPLIRQRGDFCRNDKDGCQDNILKHVGTNLLPNNIRAGRYNMKFIIYGDDHMPLSCKYAEVNYE